MDSEIKRFADVVRCKIRQGTIPEMEEIERGMREAALRDGSYALSTLLSEIPDYNESGLVCHHCKSVMENLGRRQKGIVTLLGDSTVSRMYYECSNPDCHEHRFPKDELLDISDTSFSPGVRRLMAKVGSNDAFNKGSLDLQEFSGINVQAKDVERVSEAIGRGIEEKQQAEMKDYALKHPSPNIEKTIPIIYVECDGTGVPVTARELDGRKGKQADGSAKTREAKLGCVFTQTSTNETGKPIRDSNSTSYVGSIESVGFFGKRIEAEAVRRGLWAAETVVFLGDGAKWVWNLADEHFFGAIQIVDFYHASEHLHKVLQYIYDSQQKLNEQEPEWVTMLEEGKIAEIISKAKALYQSNNLDSSKNFEKEIGYFKENESRMSYADFKQKGFFIGSGVIEAGCKAVIGKRLKQSGMRWSVKGANSIIALRCSLLSGRFDEYWENRRAA